MAVALQFSLSLIIDIIMHPDPVPISNIFLFDNLGKFFSACSIINSVSGLGIRTFLSTLNLFF